MTKLQDVDAADKALSGSSFTAVLSSSLLWKDPLLELIQVSTNGCERVSELENTHLAGLGLRHACKKLLE